MRFKGKVAVVTGSSRGIGKGLAIAFAKEGADVVLAARSLGQPMYREGTLKDTEAEIRALGAGGRVLAIKTDVGVRSEAEAMIDKTIKEFGRIDILVNNAWPVVFKAEFLYDLDPEIAEGEINAFRGVLNCCRAVLPQMRSQKYGRIINISSMGSKQKVPFWPVYAGLKAGVAHFSRSFAMVVGADGITVNCVGPGLTDTESSWDSLKDFIDYMISQQPIQRMGKIEDVAGAVLFLASDEASFITGQDLTVDGGSGPY
jgi:3-oxoacyl-[acyl-carrier protein] reductase